MADKYNITQGGGSVTIGSDLGYIDGAVTLNVASEMSYFAPVGVHADVFARNVKATYEVSFTLAEPTMDNLVIVFDWSNGSGTGASGNEVEFGGENMVPTERVVQIYGYVPGSGRYTRYFQLDRAVAVPGSEWSAQDDSPSLVQATFHGLYDTDDTRVGLLVDATS